MELIIADNGVVAYPNYKDNNPDHRWVTNYIQIYSPIRNFKSFCNPLTKNEKNSGAIFSPVQFLNVLSKFNCNCDQLKRYDPIIVGYGRTPQNHRVVKTCLKYTHVGIEIVKILVVIDNFGNFYVHCRNGEIRKFISWNPEIFIDNIDQVNKAYLYLFR